MVLKNSTRRRLIISHLCLFPVLISFTVEIFQHKTPCFLCLIERYSWVCALLFSLLSLFFPKSHSFSHSFSQSPSFSRFHSSPRSPSLKRIPPLSIRLMRISLGAAAAFSILQCLIHQGVLPCINTSAPYLSTSHYIHQLSKSPPCNNPPITIGGVPLHIYSILMALLVLSISFFKTTPNKGVSHV